MKIKKKKKVKTRRFFSPQNYRLKVFLTPVSAQGVQLDPPLKTDFLTNFGTKVAYLYTPNHNHKSAKTNTQTKQKQKQKQINNIYRFKMAANTLIYIS